MMNSAILEDELMEDELMEDEEYLFNPREYISNLGTMLCVHRKYNLGDNEAIHKLQEEIRSHKKYSSKMEYDYDFESASELFLIAEKIDLFAFSLPIYMYDHSAISISTTPFSCQFDSGQLGFIYLTKEDAYKHYNIKRITKSFKSEIEKSFILEVEEYNNYIE